ncbi:hypothetical protein MIR68_009531 [Amoeboaphelidium protococcarum]|nr:hypothetical protein MIR68_009531 [Amoeboaphelidium protococcarum]
MSIQQVVDDNVNIIGIQPTDPEFISQFKKALCVRWKVFVLEQRVNPDNEVDHIDFNMSDEDFQQYIRSKIKQDGDAYQIDSDSQILPLIQSKQSSYQTAHLIAYSDQNQVDPVGTLRIFMKDNHVLIGRMAVMKEARGRRIGRELMDKAVQLIRRQFSHQASKIMLHAQSDKQQFYERCGFTRDQSVSPFEEEGIMHVLMFMDI